MRTELDALAEPAKVDKELARKARGYVEQEGRFARRWRGVAAPEPRVLEGRLAKRWNRWLESGDAAAGAQDLSLAASASWCRGGLGSLPPCGLREASRRALAFAAFLSLAVLQASFQQDLQMRVEHVELETPRGHHCYCLTPFSLSSVALLTFCDAHQKSRCMCPPLILLRHSAMLASFGTSSLLSA